MATLWLSSTETMAMTDLSATFIEAPSYDLRALSLLPHGKAWSRRPGTMTRDMTVTSARTMAMVHTEIDRLRAESNPLTADASIVQWEQGAGVEEPAIDLDQRRLDVVARLRAREPLSLDSARVIASELGYESVNFEPLFRPFRCGSRCGQRLMGHGPSKWESSLRIDVSPSIPEHNDRLVSLFNARIQGHMTAFVRFI